MFRSVLFLGKKGLAFRGDSTRDGILYELMLERTYNLPRERQWIERRDNWLSDTIQNEIIQLYECAIQREIVSRATSSPYYGLTADGTTDSSTTEQFSLTLQYVDENLDINSDFLGFYNAPDSSGETLFRCIKDVFLRLNIPIERLHGYCFDGASNMSGRFLGVQAFLRKLCPGSLFVHCANHSLDLVLQETAREVGLIADSVNFVQGVAVVISESAKRKELYQSMFGCDEIITLLAICPTRWCIRTVAVKRVCSAYREIIKTLQQLKEDKTVRGETRAKIGGLLRQAMKAKTYYGLLCCEAIFEPCESVARSLQHTKASALGALNCAELLIMRMDALRNDPVSDTMLQTVSTAGLEMPGECRVAKTPGSFRHAAGPEEDAQVAQHTWRREFYETVDLVTAKIKRRFDQE
ncbi:putative zinc finger MYM-type protein 1-like, partial [Triplophysa rosa]